MSSSCCTPWLSTTEICAAAPGGVNYIDGNPVFFPIDNQGQSPTSEYGIAKVPEPVYNGNWQNDPSGDLHNFHFTSEIRFWFEYDPASIPVLAFTGDDDVWVFINNRVAVDLGGIHVPVRGSVDLTTRAAELGLEPGNVYEIAVFHAEREKDGSSFRLTLSGFNTSRSECSPVCGDGIVVLGERCDDGVNPGGYGKCNPDCTLGEYCGDRIINGPEECDDGNTTSGDGCSNACLIE